MWVWLQEQAASQGDLRCMKLVPHDSYTELLWKTFYDSGQ